MKTSKQGFAFITKWEGALATAYKDSAGHLSIGVGHLLTQKEKQTGYLSTGECWREGISAKTIQKLLQKDIKQAEMAVNELVRAPLSQHQFDALVSFTFNVGRNNLKKSTLLKKLNAGDYASVPSELAKWRKAGGKVISGLVRRRRAEGALWRTATLKHPIKSRTNQGAVVVGAGQVLNVISEATQISRASDGLASAFGEYAQWASIVITLAGIAYVLYARWDDRRHGIR